MLGTACYLREMGGGEWRGLERISSELSRKQLRAESQSGSDTSLGEEKGAGLLTSSSLRLERPGQAYSVDTRQR